MKIRLIELDDWQALYIDGKCVVQDHSLNLVNVIKKIAPDIDFKVAYLNEDEIDGGWCPQNWSEKLEKRTAGEDEE